MMKTENFNRKFYIRFFVLFLCCAFCFTFCFAPRADAFVVTLTTAGVVAIVVAFLSAAGISLAFIDHTQSSATASLEDLLLSYVSTLGISSILGWIGEGVNLVNGAFELAPSVADKLEAFGDWVVQNWELTDNMSDVVFLEADFNGQPLKAATSWVGIVQNGVKYGATANNGTYFLGLAQSNANATYAFVVGSSYYTASVGNWAMPIRLGNATTQRTYSFSAEGTVALDTATGLYWVRQTGITSDITYVFLPSYPTVDDALADLHDVIVNGGSGIDVNTDVIGIPDTSSMEQTDVLVLDWGLAESVTYEQAIDSVMTEALAGTFVATSSIAAPTPEPSPSPAPVPVDPNPHILGIDLPSFDFNLSGIWSYVVSWVGSLGAFLSTLFTVWSGLPYAMVVPVYATAVITIVLGVYRRFFM